ncbi:hypothetical protein HPB50_023372 [Hyalomma asiaticum]|uniref:Uncharacterized protein n=1 Tax=Hyalomma asiaticum TaxID=266040 RepID=A0ACB7TMU8_HYAAI|nr:hypothetical protein HPB50_023372 [Hyalomma asiaticum]
MAEDGRHPLVLTKCLDPSAAVQWLDKFPFCCRNCGRVGHRQDVCPHPTEKVCDKCGHGPPGPDHVCSAPKCALCGGAHVTGDRTCRSRYQVPYLVRRRRQRRRRRNKSRSSPVPAASLLPQSKPTRAVQRQGQATPGSSRAPDACKPTWVDKVTGKGETRAPARSCSLPQPVTDKIESLERENAFLRKELSEIKALLKTPPPREQRDSNASEPPAASNPARGAKKRAGPALEAEEPLTMSSIIAHMTALLEQFRADILSEINPLKLQMNEITARVQILEADRHPQMQGRQILHH